MQTIRFGTDGWRGIIADDVTFASVRRVAAAIARTLAAPEGGMSASLAPGHTSVVVGHDTRFQGPAFAQAAASLLADHGFTVYLTDRFAPTPAFGWAAVERGSAGALVVTASHNPPVYSGLKLKDSRGAPVPSEFTARIEAELDRDGAHPDAPAGPPGQIVRFDPGPSYLRRLTELVDVQRVMSLDRPVVIDAMCGAGQGYLRGLLAEGRLDVAEIAAEANPLFGGRQPEPVPANLKNLQTLCRGRGAVGIALDGDGDRLGVVDEMGRAWSPHQLMAVIVEHMARHRGGRGRVVKGFAVGRQVDAVAAAWDLPLVVVPIGFKHIANHMVQGDVLVGGEESGGIGIQGHLPERDGSLVALLLLEAMAWEGCRAQDLLDRLEAHVGPSHYRRVDWELPRGLDRAEILARLAALRRGLPGDAPASVDDLDGLKLGFADASWILFRPSGTEPLLRVYAEAGDPDRLDGLMAAAAQAVRGAMGAMMEDECGRATA